MLGQTKSLNSIFTTQDMMMNTKTQTFENEMKNEKKILFLISLLFFTTTVFAEPIKLTLHHFFVPQDVPQKQMLEPCCKRS